MKLRYSKLTSLSALLFTIILFCLTFISCKDQIYQTGFDEPENPVIHDLSEWQNITPGLHLSFGNTDKHYSFRSVPINPEANKQVCTGWKGERINLMFLLWSSEYQENINISAGPLSGSDNNIIDSTRISIHPLRYVLTDEFLSGCGDRNPDTIPASIVPDILDNNQVFNLIPQSVRPVWGTINIPQDVEEDVYSGIINIKSGESNLQSLSIELSVINQTLPDPAEWNFHLDLWQNPFAVARFHKVEPWSQEHINLLRPYLTFLAEAGQKCITTSIIHQPWGSQTYDSFDSMIRWIKNSTGTWMFDFSIFDQYVKLAMECGITRQINCYSMVPWGNRIQYFDEDSAKYITVTVKPGTPEHEAIWKPFLHQFSYHLEQMGWLEKTTIAMDERGMKEMKAEQTWKGWDTAALRNSGYLHRAYNSWPENPLQDSRFRSWPAGDTYQVYPGPRSSVRFEKLREGIQDYEKIRIINETLDQYPETDSIRQKINKILEMVSLKNLSEKPAS